MAGRDSSSKRKSSKRKRDTTSSKKKSRRKESKKRSRIHDSLSSYSDGESSNSEYTSSSKSDHRRRINKNKRIRRDYSSSFDDQSLSADSDSSSSDYKHKKTRNSRALLKSTKKRARQRSTRPKGDGDSHSGRKRKRPKKKLSKKKPKKHLSSRFSSSDSESCSTCRGSSSSSSSIEESKRRRSKVSFKARKKRRVRSPSCSPCDRGGERSVSVGRSDGAFSPVINNFNNSRRLRSVIAVVDQRCDEGENRWEKDPNKEEIVYDRNDYPSPKSMDSNEGGTKTELESVAGEEVTEMEKSRIYEGNRDNDSSCHSKAVDINNFEKGKEIDTSAPVSALGDDVLESILRQKALENLKKFKGRLQTGPTSTNVKVNNESNTNRPSDAIIENVTARETNENSGLKRDLSQPTEVKKLTDSEDVEKEETIMDTQSVEHPIDGAALLKCSIEDKHSSFDAVSTKPILSSEICSGAETTNASIAEPSSSIGQMSSEHSLERENESKDGSEFETKTMSVMRGGEMVQVSYKVYIPKKATALARRQLRR